MIALHFTNCAVLLWATLWILWITCVFSSIKHDNINRYPHILYVILLLVSIYSEKSIPFISIYSMTKTHTYTLFFLFYDTIGLYHFNLLFLLILSHSFYLYSRMIDKQIMR